MRTKLASAFLAIGLLASSMSSMVPANAIFGLSACEKATKAILAEEKIGFESWKYYAQLVAQHNYDSKWTRSIAEAIAEVYKSDKSVWAIAQKNMKCYTPAQNAEVRRQITITNKAVSDYKSLLADKNLNYYSYDWRPYYKKYYSAVDMLKKIKSLPVPTPNSTGKNA
jgi:hypothetical protein